MTITAQQSPLLFKALFANGCFSTLSGIAFLGFSTIIAPWLGLTQPLVLVVTGFGLLLFGLDLLRYKFKGEITRASATVISLLDLGWVIGSIALVYLLPDLLTIHGNTAVLAVALIVCLFFFVQSISLWRSG